MFCNLHTLSSAEIEFSAHFTVVYRPVARKMLVNCHHSRVEGPRVLPLEKFVRKITQFCAYLHGTAMCHWQRLIKCREKYMVTWASVGA